MNRSPWNTFAELLAATGGDSKVKKRFRTTQEVVNGCISRLDVSGRLIFIAYGCSERNYRVIGYPIFIDHASQNDVNCIDDSVIVTAKLTISKNGSLFNTRILLHAHC